MTEVVAVTPHHPPLLHRLRYPEGPGLLASHQVLQVRILRPELNRISDPERSGIVNCWGPSAPACLYIPKTTMCSRTVRWHPTDPVAKGVGEAILPQLSGGRRGGGCKTRQGIRLGLVGS